jgi:hypothetical protein
MKLRDIVSPNITNIYLGKEYVFISSSYFSCYGINFLNPNSCGGIGSCVDIDNCFCNKTAFYGPTCNNFTCFDLKVDGIVIIINSRSKCLFRKWYMYRW